MPTYLLEFSRDPLSDSSPMWIEGVVAVASGSYV
jgi:hypothetical protein